MNDERRTKADLIAELRALRSRVVELELPNPDPGARQLRELLDQIPAILWTTDLELRLTWWRGGGVEVLGLDTVAVRGTNVYELYQTTNPEHPAVHAHRAALEGEARNFEVCVLVGGQERWLRAHIEPLRISGAGIIRGVIGVALDITERLRAENDRERLIGELRQALDEVKTLSGLIPICMHCKSMRDDQGYWQQVDTFIRTHAHAELTHGICPACAQKLMVTTR